MRRSTINKYHRVKCRKCGKEISKSNIRKHEKKCKKVSSSVVHESQARSSENAVPREPAVTSAVPSPPAVVARENTELPPLLSERADGVRTLEAEAETADHFVASKTPDRRLGSRREQRLEECSSEKLIKQVSHAYKMRFHLFLEKKCDIKWLEESSKEYHRTLYEKVIENGGNRQAYYRILKSSSLGWGSLEIRLLKLFTYKMRTCAGSWIQKNYRDEALDYLLKIQECIPANEGFSLEKLYSTWSGPNMAIFGPIELMQCTNVRFSQVCRCRTQTEAHRRPQASGYVRLRDSGLLSHGVWVEDCGWRKTLKNLCDHAFRAAREELRALLGEIMVTKEPPEQKSKFVKWFEKTWVGKDFQYQDEVINLFECLYYFNEVDQSGDPLFFSLFRNKMNLTWVIPIGDKDQILYAPKTHKDSVPLANEVSKEVEQSSNLGFATWTDFFCTQGSSFHQRNTFQWFMECYEKHREERAVVLKLKKKNK